MDNEIYIGIDCGESYAKSTTSTFGAGSRPLPGPAPIKSHIVELKGTEYTTGESKSTIEAFKYDSDDERFLVPHLRVFAEDMSARGLTEADIRVGVGAPLMRVGSEWANYQDYLMRYNPLRFKYEGTEYTVNILSVDVFPQAFAAVATETDKYADSVIVDIGSRTIDILPMIGGEPDIANCRSLNSGFLTCFNDITEHTRELLGQDVTLTQFNNYLLKKTSCFDSSYASIFKHDLDYYVESVYDQLVTLGYNLDLSRIVFMGGGATIMKNYGTSKYEYDFECNCDIRANAKGYQALLQLKYGEQK